MSYLHLTINAYIGEKVRDNRQKWKQHVERVGNERNYEIQVKEMKRECRMAKEAMIRYSKTEQINA